MSECILWDKAVSNTGYGQKWYQGRMIGAHRYVYIKTFGSIPNGLMVLHRCDVKRCVNPEHLYLGTVKDNAKDAIERGQIATGTRHGAYTKPHSRRRGTKNPNSKLTTEQIEEIRALFKPKHWTLQQAASRYGVSISTISRVVRGDSYQLIEALNAEK